VQSAEVMTESNAILATGFVASQEMRPVSSVLILFNPAAPSGRAFRTSPAAGPYGLNPSGLNPALSAETECSEVTALC